MTGAAGTAHRSTPSGARVAGTVSPPTSQRSASSGDADSAQLPVTATVVPPARGPTDGEIAWTAGGA
eukprot:872899-Prymnesium_polylepis.2